MPGWEKLQNNFWYYTCTPSMTGFVFWNSSNLGPDRPIQDRNNYRRRQTQFSRCLTLPLTSRCLAFFLWHEFVIGWCSHSLAAPGAFLSLAEVHSHFRQAVSGHHVRFFTSSPLHLPRKQKPSEFVLQCTYVVFNLVFAVLSALIRKTIQRNEPFVGPESCAAND